MKLIYENDLSEAGEFKRFARQAETAAFLGSPALCLDGLVVFPHLELTCGLIEVEIAAEKSCYPGVAFRVQDQGNYELAYAQPHTSGQWDAIQYDPVFHGTNTWQLYHGAAYQQTAQVPTHEWVRLRVGFTENRMVFWVNEQPPLLVEHLAHPTRAGWMGLWTYLPAYYRNLKIWDAPQFPEQPGIAPNCPSGTVTEWQVEGYGVIPCEPNGSLNVSRYLPISVQQVRLKRSFEISAGEVLVNGPVNLGFGFSDTLALELDGQVIYQGENKFGGFETRESRGYVDQKSHHLALEIAPGQHTLTATLGVSEYFGWGLALAMEGPAIHWLPAGLE